VITRRKYVSLCKVSKFAEYYAKGNQARYAEHCRKWRSENPEKWKQVFSSYNKKYYRKHKKMFKKLNAKHYEDNSKSIIGKAQKRYAIKYFKYPWVYVYTNLKTSSKKRDMPFLITREEFYRWYREKKQECEYCGLPDISIDQYCNRGRKLRRFTIDRKDNSLPYTIENMCFSCWTCNRGKSDIFGYAEWMEIAQKYIKPRWQNRLIQFTEEAKKNALS